MSSSHIQLFCPKEREPISQSEQQENEIVVGTSHSQCSNSTILQTCNVLASSENKTLNIRILLDSGSERTFILREVAEALNLEPIRKERLLLYSFGKKNPEPSDFDLVQLQLKNPHNPNHRIPIEALITQHISGASLDSRFLVNKIKMLAEVSGLEPADSGKGKNSAFAWYGFFLRSDKGCAYWRHCDGKLNPADLITRGCDAEELLYSTHWFCGPPFLSLPEEKWPISKLPPSKTIEGQSERRSKIEISLHCATEKNENGREPVLKFENYSSWERLRRLTAWIQRFCRNARK
ncbi:DUF1758 domain-containing protein [Nephila pilipes]|uniref:DUF1758 domain-containing protein n=1 Tax=Nephila pilipes TaxID=299642 RepID=A0A8X6IZA1_NEPPI|nr:DUF1758 domain-containing protein [Nephila pilipes]